MLLKTQRRFEFTDFRVDLTNRSLLRDGRTVSLSPKTFDLLLYFVLNPQRLVTKVELMGALWHDAHVEESNLGQHIFLLRKALTARQPGEKLIVSVPGHGYRFTVPVVSVDETPSESVAMLQGVGSHAGTPSAESRPSFAQPGADGRFLIRGDVSPGHPPEENKNEPGDLGTPTAHGRLATFLRPGRQLYILIGFVLILTIAGCWLGLRSLRHPHTESLRVVIDDFENDTGDQDFDPAIRTAFGIDLRQSPYIDVAPQADVRAKLSDLNVAPGSQVSAQLARQACQRLSGQAYITGTLRRFAEKYLVTIQAFDCASGNKLAGSKGIANTADGLLAVTDKVAADIRKQLGESAKSVARFDKPVFSARSGSLESVKVYSDASLLALANKQEESIPLFQRAIELDPQFTLAYADLGVVYDNLGEKDLASANLTKAYEMRDSVDEPDRLFITAAFNDRVTRDLQASIRNDRAWAEEYPRNPAPIADLADLQTQSGKPALALDPVKRAIDLNPNDGRSYIVLARAQMHLGRFEEAAATCNQAIQRHIDGPEVHGFLMQIAYLRLDQSAIDEQVAWAKGKPAEPYIQAQLGLMYLALGRVKAAQSIFSNLIDSASKHPMSEQANGIAGRIPRAQAELGYIETARSILSRFSDGGNSADMAVALAEVGDTERAETAAKQASDARPSDTLWQEYLAPQVRAAVALSRHDFDAALAALEPALPYDLRSFDAVSMRGLAYLASKQGLRAETEFHKILDHPGVEPFSYNYPLAQLGLARALAQEGKIVDAGFAYKIVLSIWKDADSDLPRLREAKAEYAKLNDTTTDERALTAKPGFSHAAIRPGQPKSSQFKSSVAKSSPSKSTKSKATHYF